MHSFVPIYSEAAHFVCVVEVTARELFALQDLFIRSGIEEHLKIEGLMSTKRHRFQIGIFAYNKEDGEKILALLERSNVPAMASRT